MRKVKIKQRLIKKKQKTCPPSEDRPRDAVCRLKPCQLRAGYKVGFAAHLQSAPMKNNLLEKLTYFSNDSPDLSQTYRHHMWVCKQHVCAKFDHSSFDRSRDNMIGTHQNFNGPRPFPGCFYHPWVGTCYC